MPGVGTLRATPDAGGTELLPNRGKWDQRCSRHLTIPEPTAYNKYSQEADNYMAITKRDPPEQPLRGVSLDLLLAQFAVKPLAHEVANHASCDGN